MLMVQAFGISLGNAIAGGKNVEIILFNFIAKLYKPIGPAYGQQAKNTFDANDSLSFGIGRFSLS